MARMNIAVTELVQAAQELRSEDGENPEYDRALVELVSRASGNSDDSFPSVAHTLGIPWTAAPQPVPTEITLKVVLDLCPGDDARDAVQEYFAENGVPEPVSVVDLQ